MKGLLIKDFFLLQKTLKTYLAIMVVYGVIGISTNQAGFISGFIGILAAMLPITALAYDERANWDKYALTMPVTKKDIVLGKYALGILLTLCGFVFGFVAFIFMKDTSWTEKLVTVASMSLVGILYQAVILPLMFKFGTEKGRIYMMCVFFIPFIVILLGAKFGFFTSDMIESWVSNAWVFPVVSVIAYGVSIKASIAIYEKREL